MDPAAFVAELEPTVARLLDRHLTQAKEWFPHESVLTPGGATLRPRVRVVAR